MKNSKGVACLILFSIYGLPAAFGSELIEAAEHLRSQIEKKDGLAQKRFFCEDFRKKKWRELTSKVAASGECMSLVSSDSLNPTRKLTWKRYSPSGDWVYRQEYFFYENGTVALVIDEHTAAHAFDSEKDEVINQSVTTERRIYQSRLADKKMEKVRLYVKGSKRTFGSSVSIPGPSFGVVARLTDFPFVNLLHSPKD